MKKNLVQTLRRHPLIDVLYTCKGNPRVLLLIEPLWGIPFQLLAPFITLYMVVQGITDVQIGLIATLAMLVQVFFAFFGGIITDKMGRKKATLMADFFGWTVPPLIWAISNNFWLFLIAALINSFEFIGQTCWQCLLVEDAKEKDLLKIYTLIHIAALIAILFAPITGLLMEEFSLVPVVRGLYVFFAICMVVKIIITYIFCKETEQGKKRKAETKGVPLAVILSEYKGLIPNLLRDKTSIKVMVINVCLHIILLISNAWVGVNLAERLGVAERYLALFPILNAAVMLVFMMGIQHKLEHLKNKIPMWLGLGLIIGASILFILIQGANFPLIILYLLLVAVSSALVMPRRSAMLQAAIDPKERARIMGIFTALTLLFAAPFGLLAGVLSEIDRRLPFGLIILLAVVAIVVVGYLKEESLGMQEAVSEEKS